MRLTINDAANSQTKLQVQFPSLSGFGTQTSEQPLESRVSTVRQDVEYSVTHLEMMERSSTLTALLLCLYQPTVCNAFPPPFTPTPNHEVTEVHVVAACHLDAGYK